jgi:hypothetical protein
MGNYLEKVKKIHEETLKTSQQEGNETFRGLNIQLIFFAAAILSFSLLIFLNKDIINNINIVDKIILILTWIGLGLSVLFGLTQFFVTYNFFKEHSKLQTYLIDKLENDNEITKTKRALGIYSKEQEIEINKVYEGIVDKMVYEKAKELVLTKFPNILPESSEIFIKIQSFLIGFSITALIFFMVRFLFSS